MFRNHEKFETEFYFLNEESKIEVLKYLFEESIKYFLNKGELEKAFLIYSHTSLGDDQNFEILNLKIKNNFIYLNGPFFNSNSKMELNLFNEDELIDILKIKFKPIILKNDLSPNLFNSFFKNFDLISKLTSSSKISNKSFFSEDEDENEKDDIISSFNSNKIEKNFKKKQKLILKTVLLDMQKLNIFFSLESLKFLIENEIFSVEFLINQPSILNSFQLRNYFLNAYFLKKELQKSYLILLGIFKFNIENGINLNNFLNIFKYLQLNQIENILKIIKNEKLNFIENLPMKILIENLNLNAKNINNYTNIFTYLEILLPKEKYDFLEFKLIEIYSNEFDLLKLKKIHEHNENLLYQSILFDLYNMSKTTPKLKRLIVSYSTEYNTSLDSKNIISKNNSDVTLIDNRFDKFEFFKNLKFLFSVDQTFLKEIFHFYLNEGLFAHSYKIFHFLDFDQKEKELIIFDLLKEKLIQSKEISKFNFYLDHISIDGQKQFLKQLFKIALEYENMNFISLIYSIMRNQQQIFPSTEEFEKIVILFSKNFHFTHLNLILDDFLQLKLIPTKKMILILLNNAETEFQFNSYLTIANQFKIDLNKKKYNYYLNSFKNLDIDSKKWKDYHSIYFNQKLNLRNDISKLDLGYEEISNLDLISLQK
eukprot:gene4170-7480_t